MISSDVTVGNTARAARSPAPRRHARCARASTRTRACRPSMPRRSRSRLLPPVMPRFALVKQVGESNTRDVGVVRERMQVEARGPWPRRPRPAARRSAARRAARRCRSPRTRPSRSPAQSPGSRATRGQPRARRAIGRGSRRSCMAGLLPGYRPGGHPAVGELVASATVDRRANRRRNGKRAAILRLQPAGMLGGVDGTRTRDPRRDRPVF